MGVATPLIQPRHVASLLAAVGIALAAACGETAADAGPEQDAAIDANSEPDAQCSLAIEPVPIEDPCEALSDNHDACCATAGCSFHKLVTNQGWITRCVREERICTEQRDGCALDQRCERSESPQMAKSDCEGGSLAFWVRGICVENPRAELCFDRCAKLRTFSSCCAEAGCAWHSSHGLCVSEELDCTDDPGSCPAGLRCEVRTYPYASTQRTDCGDAPDFDIGPGIRGVCTPEL
jgi:hypothetical protein